MTTELVVSMPKGKILNADLEIEIKINGKKEGDLLITRRSLDFYPSGNTVNFHRLQWSQIKSVFENSGSSRPVKT